MPSISITQKVGLLQVGRNVTLNSVGTLSNGTASISLTEGLVLPKSNVTQIEGTTTTVTTSGRSGVITGFAGELGPVSSSSYTVVNSKVTEGSVVLVSILEYNGSTGVPVVYTGSISDGSFAVIIVNAHAVADVNGAIKIAYLIV